MMNLVCNELLEIASPYIDNYEQYYNKIQLMVSYTEVSTGGLTIPRGYYCPSPIIDIVIGNVNRGKILKKPSKRSHITYRYGFDIQGKLVSVCKEEIEVKTKHKEFIVRNGNTELGIGFCEYKGLELEPEVTDITYCTYHGDGKIRSFTFGQYIADECHVNNVQKEDYVYSSQGLLAADVQLYFEWEKKVSYRNSRYHFFHDENGYLTKYSVQESYGVPLNAERVRSHFYDVTVKRKI